MIAGSGGYVERHIREVAHHETLPPVLRIGERLPLRRRWDGRAARRPTNTSQSSPEFLDANGLRGARLGVTRQGIDDAPAQVIAAFEETLDAMRNAGATLVDLDAAGFTFASADGEFLVLCSTSAMTCATTLQHARAYHSPAELSPMPLPSTTPMPMPRCRSSARKSFEQAEAWRWVPNACPAGLQRDDLQPGTGDRPAVRSERGRQGAGGSSTWMRSWRRPTIRRGRRTCSTAITSSSVARVLRRRRAIRSCRCRPGLVFGIPWASASSARRSASRALIKLASGFEAVRTHVRADNPPTFAQHHTERSHRRHDAAEASWKSAVAAGIGTTRPHHL